MIRVCICGCTVFLTQSLAFLLACLLVLLQNFVISLDDDQPSAVLRGDPMDIDFNKTGSMETSGNVSVVRTRMVGSLGWMVGWS